jgi:prevent-host-death family protein
MASITTVVARNDFSSLLNRAAFGKERVILKRRGKAIAVVVPMEDLALLQSLEDKLDTAAVLASRKETRKKGTKSLAQLRAEVGE